jgi:hypothetical protein
MSWGVASRHLPITIVHSRTGKELTMANKTDKQEFSRDGDDVELLQAVKQFLAKAEVKGIKGVGPIDEASASCKVLLAGKKQRELPDEVRITLSNKKTVILKLNYVEDSKPARLLAGPVPRPWQYSGPLMGGDPLWNDAADQWGTITFAADSRSTLEVEGYACANQSLTCSHVLNSGKTVSVSTTRYPNSMKVSWITDPPVNTKWIDLAGADMLTGVPFSPMEVRGLRAITGVRQPVPGIRVSKYGATTGLTSGRDLGWAEREVNDNGKTYWVRLVSGYFALVGDSGAPVLDAERNFLGLVVSGIPGAVDETYYIPVLPDGEAPQGPIPPGAIADLPYVKISGF